jgi:hypothetical protein
MSLVLSGDSPKVSADSTGVITSGTAQATTSGTAVDFTGIPSWVKRITVMLNGVSTNGISVKQLQLGAGSIATTGYNGIGSAISATVVTTNLSSGFPVYSALAADVVSGLFILTNISGNAWVVSSSGKTNASSSFVGGGDVTLSGTLDRIRLTTVNGTDTFDAGSVNILYE